MTQPTFVGAALATANFSTTISRVLTGVTAGNTLIAAYSANPQVLSTVSVGTTGNITFAALGTAPVAGSTMNVAGAAGGTGAITSPAYSNPTNYLVAASPSPTVTSCTLLTLASGAVTSTAGTLTMTFALNGAPSISDGDGAYTIFYGPNFSTGSNFGNWALGWRTATSTGSHTITGSNTSTVNQTQNMIVMAYSGGECRLGRSLYQWHVLSLGDRRKHRFIGQHSALAEQLHHRWHWMGCAELKHDPSGYESHYLRQ